MFQYRRYDEITVRISPVLKYLLWRERLFHDILPPHVHFLGQSRRFGNALNRKRLYLFHVRDDGSDAFGETWKFFRRDREPREFGDALYFCFRDVTHMNKNYIT